MSQYNKEERRNIQIQRENIIMKIVNIVKILLEDENVDLTMSLMREGIYECLLAVISSKR